MNWVSWMVDGGNGESRLQKTYLNGVGDNTKGTSMNVEYGVK